MCTVSMIADHYRDKWEYPYGKWSWGEPIRAPIIPTDELDAIRKEVEEMKELLKKAKAYDERTGQADCEMAEKVAFVKKVAAAVGVSLEDVFT